MSSNGSDFNLKLDLAPDPAVPQHLVKLEADVAVAEAECRAASDSVAAAERAATAAVAASEAAQSGLGKKPSAEELEAAAAAEQAANDACKARNAIVLGQSTVNQRFNDVRQRLVREHAKLTAQVNVDDSRVFRAVYKTVVDETQAVMSQVKEEAERNNVVREAAKLEVRHRREDEQAELEEMWAIIDPHHERDKKRGIDQFGPFWHLATHGDWSPSVVVGVKRFPEPPLVSGYPYPEHTTVDPELKAHRVAKYVVGDRMLLQDGHHSDLTAVEIQRVELADKALKPKAQRADDGPEAVYLVQADSTATTFARGYPPRWVNEAGLTPRIAGRQGKIGLRGGMGWARIWPQNRSFEADRMYALQEIERRLAYERAAKKVHEERVAAGLLPPRAPHSARATTTRPAAAVPPMAARPASARSAHVTRPGSANMSHAPMQSRPHSATIRPPISQTTPREDVAATPTTVPKPPSTPRPTPRPFPVARGVSVRMSGMGLSRPRPTRVQ